MTTDVGRVVALGASNLTRGFGTVVSAARTAWGRDVEVLAALGHGRSYGAASSVLCRRLPGILESSLWRDLGSLPPVPTRALVSDVGNDILYGFSAERTLAWVEEAVSRLQRVTRDILLTDLPLASIRRLSEARFLLFRSILVPSCRLSQAQVIDVAEQLDAGLATLSAVRGVTFSHLDPAWYGFDPIHIRPSLWRPAWRQILGVPSTADGGDGSPLEGLQLYFMRPERRWLFGVEQHTPQRGAALPRGGRVWLY
jgi:hypothetical protein